jgi:hypothetical protein
MNNGGSSLLFSEFPPLFFIFSSFTHFLFDLQSVSYSTLEANIESEERFNMLSIVILCFVIYLSAYFCLKSAGQSLEVEKIETFDDYFVQSHHNHTKKSSL